MRLQDTGDLKEMRKTLQCRRVGRVFETHQHPPVGLEDSTHPTKPQGNEPSSPSSPYDVPPPGGHSSRPNNGDQEEPFQQLDEALEKTASVPGCKIDQRRRHDRRRLRCGECGVGSRWCRGQRRRRRRSVSTGRHRRQCDGADDEVPKLRMRTERFEWPLFWSVPRGRCSHRRAGLPSANGGSPPWSLSPCGRRLPRPCRPDTRHLAAALAACGAGAARAVAGQVLDELPAGRRPILRVRAHRPQDRPVHPLRQRRHQLRGGVSSLLIFFIQASSGPLDRNGNSPVTIMYSVAPRL